MTGEGAPIEVDARLVRNDDPAEIAFDVRNVGAETIVLWVPPLPYSWNDRRRMMHEYHRLGYALAVRS